MEKPVLEQLVCAVLSLAGGVFFGLVYDFFKAFRLKIRNMLFTALCDLAVCLFALALLFVLFMSLGGGQARIYIGLCAAVGAMVYFVGASRFFLMLFTQIVGFFAKIFHLLEKCVGAVGKFFKFIAKKLNLLFQNLYNRYKIRVQGKIAAKAEKAAAALTEEKERENEAQTGKHHNKNRNSRAGGLRGDKSFEPEKANRGGSGKA